MQQIVKVSHLTKQFGSFTAVNQLSFSVEQGDVYGFLGQNGAGKSTTIRMLLSLITPTEGDIELFGLPLQSHRKDILQQIGAVIEKPDVYKYLSAYENLKLFASLSGIKPSHQVLMKQLEVVGLADRAHDIVKTFSQGMKQRLGIGIALVHNPQLIILDEPTNGLDPQGIADIRNLILFLSREQNKTVIVSSHLLNEIEQIATRILIIDKGKKLVEGAASNLINDELAILEMEVASKDLANQIILSSEWGDSLLPERDGKVLLKLSRKDIPSFNRLLASNGVDIYSLSSRNNLEDYFLQVTAGKQYVGTFTN
ncbi:ABC transporter ATP-binding protein [Sediminibacterium sp. TEGAF015]|uniref:ABC transporter ATP-binding protein n=1 Tax=Sediminibacterium sp. TEGAF015 TaxID=575378 RepID=UPI0022006F6E|nr:ABC transporter ATP-binding protein [Sediminibacterium sp. TEGAF015]BDQ12294.1 ABC transporter ATP-binding protein [Sediminibacterium sp. TEGAF015]